MTTALVIDFHSRRHVEMEQATEAFLRAQLAQRDEQLTAAVAENTTLVETARVLADQVAALKRWRLRALFCCPWLGWLK